MKKSNDKLPGVITTFSRLRQLGAFRASLRLLRDPNASLQRKVAIVGASALGVLYIVFPEATDLIPIIGLLDEVVVAFVVRYILAWLAKQYRTVDDTQS